MGALRTQRIAGRTSGEGDVSTESDRSSRGVVTMVIIRYGRQIDYYTRKAVRWWVRAFTEQVSSDTKRPASPQTRTATVRNFQNSENQNSDLKEIRNWVRFFGIVLIVVLLIMLTGFRIVVGIVSAIVSFFFGW